MVGIFLAAVMLSYSLYAQNESPDDLLSLDSLLNLKINTASRYQQTTAQAPSSVSIMTSEDILVYGYTTIDEIINSVRGFYISNDRNYSYAGNRGFSRPTDYNNRILLLLNGNYMSEPVFGSSPMGTDFNIPVNIIDRIEVVRGPGSAIYGSNAMFSVINVITKNSELIDRANVSISADTRNSLVTSFHYGKRISSVFNFFTGGRYSYEPGEDLYFREYDSPLTNNGIAQNLDFDKSGSFFLSAGIYDLKLSFSYFDRAKGIPTGAFSVNFNEMSYTVDRRYMIAAKYEKQLSSSLLITGNVKFDHYYYYGSYPYSSLLEEETTSSWLTPTVQLIYDIASNNRLIAGAEYVQIFNTDYIADLQLQQNKFKDNPPKIFSVFIQNDYQIFSDFSFLTGLRYDYNTDKKDFLSPRLSLIYNPGTHNTFKFIYGRAFRAPSMYEVYYEDTQTGLIRNPDLIPEDIITAELIYEQKISDYLFGSFSLFYNEINNLIDTKFDPSAGTLKIVNSSKVTASGADAEITARLESNFSFQFKYSYQYARLDQTGEWLTNSPIHLIKTGLSIPITGLGQLTFELLFDSKRKSVRNLTGNDISLLSATFFSEQFWNNFRIVIKAHNLLDAAYYHPGGFEHLMDFIEQNRRVIRFTLITEF